MGPFTAIPIRTKRLVTSPTTGRVLRVLEGSLHAPTGEQVKAVLVCRLATEEELELHALRALAPSWTGRPGRSFFFYPRVAGRNLEGDPVGG
jgi:hypothetical protein